MTAKPDLVDHLKAWLPIALLAATGLVMWTETRLAVAQHTQRLDRWDERFDAYASPVALEERVKWRVNVERDIADLRKTCR